MSERENSTSILSRPQTRTLQWPDLGGARTWDISNNYIPPRIRVSEDGNSTHSEYFAEAYVALRLGFRGHRIPHRTQPLAYSYCI